MPTVDVRLVDVVEKFGDAVAVDHINLEVLDGEFFSLLGPSGCGKTTTLGMIGGFVALTTIFQSRARRPLPPPAAADRELVEPDPARAFLTEVEA